MNKLTYLFILMAGALMFASCSDGGPTLAEKIAKQPNLAGFTESSKNVSRISDGTEYQIKLPMKVFGPSMRELSGDVTVTIEAMTTSSTAVAGTNFRIDDNTITLKESDNYLGAFYFTMLTEGIVAPLDKSPVLKLKATGVSASGNVIASGKPIEVTLNYACASNIQGIYDVEVTRDDGSVYTFTGEKVSKIGVGTYQTETVGQFGNPPMVHGLTFFDVCGTITVKAEPTTGGYYSNDIVPGASTTVNGNSQSGELTSFTLKFTIDGYHSYTSVYTKQ